MMRKVGTIDQELQCRHARGLVSGIQALWIPAFAGMTISIFSHRTNKHILSSPRHQGHQDKFSKKMGLS
jgi:hypothetical protein